ncbi:hypothetical protein CEUSTIGMA_g3507.t1 [Chlamydomonas eustigma]|uniref:RCC1-like domain-containing protein n=1 Tax=Chlamydomonas eustigma TaxID=1157962 RepID=A0A250WYY9_9CHLO|nr:hypothetical protein CEUSTIGMA_g3507.t1 [Chlamydomonas eustigma]|eukprot:GAX76064.1 hypothetical protein CEUSTIGMA_g3507.t1 [Chlamydomonas eustigma]
MANKVSVCCLFPANVYIGHNFFTLTKFMQSVREMSQNVDSCEELLAVTVQRRSSRLAETGKELSNRCHDSEGREYDTLSSSSSVNHDTHWIENSSMDKQSVALKPGLHRQISVQVSQEGISAAVNREGRISGLWGLLPEEIVEMILRLCQPSQLGMLQSTCTYFSHSKLIDKIAKHKLKSVPRAKGLKPMKKDGESNLALLHFVNCQSAAAAQATAVACGGHHTSALLIEQRSALMPEARHALFTFGRDFHGQLGTTEFCDRRSPTAVSLGYRTCQDHEDLEEETMPAVVANGTHYSTCISRRGELFAWGLGTYGELGLGRWSVLEVPSPRQCPLSQIRVVSVACGARHTLAIGESGSLWSCGKNSSGQLGSGNHLDNHRLQLVHNLQGSRIVSAACGALHSVALASDGSLFTWGDGSCGQLGHSQLQGASGLNADQVHVALLLPQKIARLDPSLLLPDSRITAVSAGKYHTMVLTVSGSILAFGSNESGCLGLGDCLVRWKPTKVNLVLEGEEGVCLRAVQIACGAGHTVALISRQGCLEVRTTGNNSWGQLGQGDRLAQTRFTPTAPMPRVTAVQSGDEHSAAVCEGGELYLWGRGDSGQLGFLDGGAKWCPAALKGYLVVHPDKTLRRSKRSQPYVRPTPFPEIKRQCVQHFSAHMM